MIDWRHWHNEPYLVGGLVFLGWLYAVLAGPLRTRLAPGTRFPRGQAVQFYAALVSFYLAVGSPLDQIGERFLFSVHMLQHQLLIYPAAILFLRGLPFWMVDPVLAHPTLRGPLRLLTSPLVAGLLYTLIISLWHAPVAYDWALQDKTVHVIEHLMFFGAGLLYWWPLLSPSRALPPISHGARMVYLFGVLIAMTPVFAYITFSQDVLYPTYEYAPRLFATFSAGEDQLLAGVSMKLMGLSVALAAFGVCFFKWSAASDRQKQRWISARPETIPQSTARKKRLGKSVGVGADLGRGGGFPEEAFQRASKKVGLPAADRKWHGRPARGFGTWAGRPCHDGPDRRPFQTPSQGRADGEEPAGRASTVAQNFTGRQSGDAECERVTVDDAAGEQVDEKRVLIL